MGQLKQSDLKALEWFCKQNNLRPEMSVPPFQMCFSDKETGLEKVCHLDFIRLSYNEWKKEDQKRRQREKKYQGKL